MSNSNIPGEEPCNVGAEQSQDTSAPASAEPAVIPGFFPPSLVLAQLSAIRETQPVAALATANQHRDVLTGEFLKALEEGVADPTHDFAKHGMLFNYAAYFLAKWREARAYPLFLRWFSLPGDEALELGGDTVGLHGSRFLASVCGTDVEPIKLLVQNREAHSLCRGQALRALCVLTTWGDRTREEVEAYLLFLAREGLEREKNLLWHDLADASVQLEFLSVFPELKRALQDELIEPSFMKAADLDEVERLPRGTLVKQFAERHPPITDVAGETRWWAGFQRNAQGNAAAPGIVSAGQQYVAPAKVGRNDPCPCGSGKKFKKCHGQ